jgi:predicted aldo/keto reductase-like oxidoreductase
MPCPANVDIPGTFAAYNNRYVDGFFTAEKEYMMCTTLRKDVTAAGNCVGCGKCENHCPQGIAIRDELKRARKVLEGPVYKIARKLAPLVYKY